MERVTRKDLENAVRGFVTLRNEVRAKMGLPAQQLQLEMGSSTYGHPYRLHIGYIAKTVACLGCTASEAYYAVLAMQGAVRTLDNELDFPMGENS